MRSLKLFSLLALFAVAANAQVTIFPGFGSFVDISGTGTALTAVGDDSSHGFTSTVGNDLFPAGSIAVASNGYLVANAAAGSSIFTNAAISPTTTATTVGYTAGARVLCPWWDDLYGVGAPNATIYWQEISGVLYIQYQNIGHFNVSSAAGGPAITFQVQVLQGAGCVPPTVHFIYPDATFGGTMAVNDAGASATVGYIGATVGDNFQYSFNTIGSIPDATSLTVSKPAGFGLAYSSPLGNGSLQINICSGSPGGQYQLVATLNAGAFPNGWLFGIDITIPEFQSQIGNFPFLGPLDGSGSFQLGPFGGLPSGGLLSIYSFVVDIPAGSVPTVHTPAQVYTIP